MHQVSIGLLKNLVYINFKVFGQLMFIDSVPFNNYY